MAESVSPEFWNRADAIIHLANEQVNEASTGKVSASLLYAAARFSAFDVASKSVNVDEMKTDRDEAISYFVDQFRKMLIENMDDYIENYEIYVSKRGKA